MVAASQVLPFAHPEMKKIAALTDFSPNAENGLRYAGAVARLYKAEIVLAHAYFPLPSAFAAPTPALVIETLEADRQHLRTRMLKEAGACFPPGVRCSILLLEGFPQDLLRKLSDADLIVVGTAGETGLAKTAFGSVAETVFRSSRVPVLTVGPQCAGADRDESRMERILYATDFSAEATLALPYATSLAEHNDAQLVLMHVVTGRDLPFTFDRYMASIEPREALHALVSEDVRLKYPPDYVVQFGSPYTAISEVAKTSQASVIVMGVHGANSFAGIASHLPGQTAYKIAAHATCPVLTVRKP